MADLQDSYQSLYIVAEKELKDARIRRDEAYRNFLTYQVTNEDIVKFIGDNLILALSIIFAYETSNYVLAEDGEHHHVNLSSDNTLALLDIDTIINDALPEQKEKILLLPEFLRSFFQELYADEYSNLYLDAKISGHPLLFISRDIECVDDWEYYYVLLLDQNYDFFYERMAAVFFEDRERIVTGALDGIYTGIFDLIPWHNMLDAGIDKDTPLSKYREHPNIMKKIIDHEFKNM